MNYFILTYVGKPVGESGENWGTEYIFNYACNKCGTGASVKKNLKSYKLENIAKEIFQTIDGDYIISKDLYILLKSKNIQVGNLKNVTSASGEILPFYHLFADHGLPKAAETKGLIKENQCVECRRNGYFNNIVMGDLDKRINTKVLPVRLTYNKLDIVLLGNEDILNSWEHMGLSEKEAEGNSVVRYARPLLIVSKGFKEILEECKLKNIEFESINII